MLIEVVVKTLFKGDQYVWLENFSARQVAHSQCKSQETKLEPNISRILSLNLACGSQRLLRTPPSFPSLTISIASNPFLARRKAKLKSSSKVFTLSSTSSSCLRRTRSQKR